MRDNNRELEVRLSLDDRKLIRDLKKSLRNTEAQTKKTAEKMSQSWSGVKTSALAAAAAVVGIGAAIKTVVDANRTMEALQTTFRVLYKDVDLAQAKMAEAMDFAAQTPYLLTEIVDAYGQLKVVGYDTIDWLRSVGDMASVANRPISEAANTMTRLASGSFGDAFRMLREQFFITREMLEGEGLVFDKAGSYKGSVEDAMTAVQKIITQNYGGMMEKQSQTMNGMISNLEDWGFQIREKLGKAIFIALKDDLKSLLGTISAMNESGELQLMAEDFGNAAASIYKFFGAMKYATELPGDVFGVIKKALGETAGATLDSYFAMTGGRDLGALDDIITGPLQDLAEWGTRDALLRKERLQKIKEEREEQQKKHDIAIQEYETDKKLVAAAEARAAAAKEIAKAESEIAAMKAGWRKFYHGGLDSDMSPSPSDAMSTFQTGVQAQVQGLQDERFDAWIRGDTEAVNSLTAAIARLQDKTGEGLLGENSAEKIKSEVDVLKDAAFTVGQAFQASAGQTVTAIYDMVAAHELSASEIPKLLGQMVQETVRTIAVESATRAMYELAMGFAEMALGAWGPTAAVGHFKAAAMFGAIAGGATAVGAVISGPSGGGSARSATPASSGGGASLTQQAAPETISGYAKGVGSPAAPTVVINNIVDTDSYIGALGTPKGQKAIQNVMQLDFYANGPTRHIIRGGG